MPSNSKRLKVPKELWRLLDYMFRNGMDEEDLFEDPGDPDEIRFLRERLDMNESFDTYKGSVHSVATCLLRFLDSLSPPVIPPDFAKRALDASSSATASKQLIAKLPAVHFNVFHYVMAFLRELLAHAARNGLTAERVAYAFAAVLMRGDGSQSNSINFKKRAQFLMHFLRDVQVSEGNSDGEMLLAT
jgi:phosphatidylinositol-bisphosphatase